MVVPCQLYIRFRLFSFNGIVLCPILSICHLCIYILYIIYISCFSFSICDAWSGIWRTSKTGEKRNSANWVFHCNILCGKLLTKTWRRRRSGRANKIAQCHFEDDGPIQKTFGSLNIIFYVFLGANLRVSYLENVCLCCRLSCDVHLACIRISCCYLLQNP